MATYALIYTLNGKHHYYDFNTLNDTCATNIANGFLRDNGGTLVNLERLD